MNSFGDAINKFTSGWNSNVGPDSSQADDFYPAKPPLGNLVDGLFCHMHENYMHHINRCY